MGAHFEGEYDGNGELDVFHHEDTTQMIISYLSEDAKFCFALTSKKNRERVDTWNDRDKRYLRERDDPQFRRALVLHDAAREGHLRIIIWLAENLDTCVSVVCTSEYASCPLFETYTCHPRQYFLATKNQFNLLGKKDLFNEYETECPDFGNGGDLFLSDVAARYGRHEIVAWIDVRYGMNRYRRDMVYAMATISGHRHLDRFRLRDELSSGAIRMILQRAPLDEIRRTIRITDFNGKYFPLEYLAKRGDVTLFEEYCKKIRKTEGMSLLVESVICGAIMTGDERTIEAASVASDRIVQSNIPGIFFRTILRDMMIKWATNDDILTETVRADARTGTASVIDQMIAHNQNFEVAHVLDRIRLLPPDKRHELWTDDRIDSYVRMNMSLLDR